MPLWKYLVEYYSFSSEQEVEAQCEMFMVTVNGVATENHLLLIGEGDYVAVIKKVTEYELKRIGH